MAKKKKLTDAERRRIEEQVKDLQAALDDVEDAPEGTEEEQRAEAELARERAATAALFEKLDLSEEDYDLLIGAVAAGTEARTREIVREELGEEPTPTGEGEGEGGGLGELQENPDAPPVPPGDAPPEAEPASQHWTEKRVFGRDKVKPDGDS